MFAPWLLDAWITATIVALMAGSVGLFVVIGGRAFAAHTIPLGAFPGAAAATLLGVDQTLGLLAFSLLAVAGIARLGGRDDGGVGTALALVLLLGTGALFLSLSGAYAPSVFALLFGELLGVGRADLLPVALLGAASVATTLALFRPLLLGTVSGELAAARGLRPGRLAVLLLLNVALASAAALPVVGALLVFTLMVGPASLARGLTDRPLPALALSAGTAVGLAWGAIALSLLTDWPVGFFVGVGGAGCYAAGRMARREARRPAGLPA